MNGIKKRSLQEVHDQALKATLNFCKAESELVEALIEVQTMRVYAKLGYSSIFRYCVESLKLSESVAYGAITAARKAIELPNLRIEIQNGEISISKLRKFSGVINSANELEWIQKAKTLTSRAIEKEVAKLRPQEAYAESARYVTDKRVELRLGISESLMLKMRKSQDFVSSSKGAHASLEETLEKVFDSYLRQKDPVLKARRVVVKSGSPKTTNPITSVKLFPGTVVRTPIPAAIQHAVNLRDDRRCQFKRPDGAICGERRWTELHHVVPVGQGGQHSADNLKTLCRVHHQLTHEPEPKPNPKPFPEPVPIPIPMPVRELDIPP